MSNFSGEPHLQSEVPGDDVDAVKELLLALTEARTAVSEIVVGQETAVDELFICLMSGGNALVEGSPGLGKTLLVRTLAEVCGLQYSRIQFTPDLMPADITGTLTLHYEDNGKMQSKFQPGPIFAQLVLTDEINRATPKTQSALLEAMQEHTVTVAGTEYRLPEPFFVIATQNPIEMEGTYQLPEAQIDRFFLKVTIPFPTHDTLNRILTQTTGISKSAPRTRLDPGSILRLQLATRQVPVASTVQDRIVRFVLATQPDNVKAPAEVRRYVRYGVSPRGAQALVLASKAHALLRGRYNIGFEDVRAVLSPALQHRVSLNYSAEADGVEVSALLGQVWDKVGTP